MVEKSQPESSKDREQTENFLNEMNLLTDSWQERISALSSRKRETLQVPTLLKIRNSQPRAANFFGKMGKVFNQRVNKITWQKDRATLPNVTFIAPGVFVIDATQVPQIEDDSCSPLNMGSGNNCFDF